MKKVISLVMSISMILSSVGASCFAESVNKENQEQTTSEVEKSVNKTLEDEICGKEEGQKIDVMCECALSRIMQGPVASVLKSCKENELKDRKNALKDKENILEKMEKAFNEELKYRESALKERERAYNDRKKAYEDRKKAYDDREKAFNCREDNFKRMKGALEKIKNERKNSTTAFTFIR